MVRHDDDPRFSDRDAAGRLLATQLADEEWRSPVALGLARGGVPVAYEVAAGLLAPLDVLVVRKIGAPGQPEFGVGAVTADDPPFYDQQTLRRLGLREEDMLADCARERAKAHQRAELYQQGRQPVSLEHRDVIVCDDGLATGVTARAALRHVRRQGPRTVVFAAPVCAPDAAEQLLTDADRVVCLARPAHFQAVGQFYHAFTQTTDDEVRSLLDTADRNLARTVR